MLREAADELRELAGGPVSRERTLPRVQHLLQLFTIADPVTSHGQVSEKIAEVRVWFEEMAKKRRQYSDQSLHSFVTQAIGKLERWISADGRSLKKHL